MAKFYRIWVKYPPVQNTSLYAELPPDFAGGRHGTLCLNYDAAVWFAPPDGHSDQLARRFLGAASGKLAEDFAGVQSYLYIGDSDVVAGITSVSVFKVVNFRGAIGVSPQGSGVFSTVVYFSREPVWADRSNEDKLAILLRKAEKYAGPEARLFIQSLLPMLAQVAVVMACLAGLGALLGPVLAFAIAAAIGIAFVLQRGDQYVEKFKTINAVLESTTVNEANANDRELEAGAQAMAAFIAMLLQDVISAAGAKALAALRNVLTNRSAKSVSAAADEVNTPAPQAGPGALSFQQIYVASGRAFKGMPSFSGKGYDALATWLEANGFTKVKEAGFEEGTTLPGTRNANKGGSEIWVRRDGPLRPQGMIEAVRVDRLGHDPTFEQSAGGFNFPANWVKLRGVAGTKGHFHKEVIAGDMESTYVQQWVKNKLDFNDYNTAVEVTGEPYFRQIHVPMGPQTPTGAVQPGGYPSARYGR
jgi:hypothetical protein